MARARPLRLARRLVILRDVWTRSLMPLPALAALLAASPAAAELSPETLETLAKLDRLTAPGDPELFHLGARWIVGQREVEVDGAPPREHVVEVQEYTGEGTWQTEYHLYGEPIGGVPRRLAPPLVGGGYREAGYLLTVDATADGRETLVVVGDTSGDSPSTVDGWRWVEGGFVPVIAAGDPGVEYAALELGFEGEALVALDPESDEPAVLGPVDGVYLQWAVAPGPWVERLMVRAATVDAPGRAQHFWRAVGRAVRAAGLAPSAETQRALAEAHAQLGSPWEHAALVEAMGWPGNEAARGHLRALWAAPTHADVRAAAIEALVVVGDEADREAALAALDGASAGVIGAVVDGFEAVGDGRAIERLEAALSRSGAGRAAIVRALKTRAAGVPALTGALARASAVEAEELAGALRWLAIVAPHAAAWRTPGVAAALWRAAEHPSAAVRAGVIEPLRRADRRAADALRLRAAVEDDPGVLLAVLDALAEAAPDLVAIRHAAVERLMAGGVGRETLHRLVAGHGSAASRAVAARWAETPGAIGVHARSFARRPLAAGAARAAMVEALAARLAPGEPDRVRQAAAQALGALGAGVDPAGRAALVGALGDARDWVRSAAAEALSTPDPAAARALWAALGREPSRYVRGDIVEALGGQGEAAVAGLVERLGDAELRWHAAHALARSAAGRRALVERVAAYAAAGACAPIDVLLGALARAGAAEAREAFAVAVGGCPTRRSTWVGAVLSEWPRDAAGGRGWLAPFIVGDDRESLRRWLR